ncbi:hypothetical protein AB5N19_01739 [Seiridium cardinale]
MKSVLVGTYGNGYEKSHEKRLSEAPENWLSFPDSSLKVAELRHDCWANKLFNKTAWIDAVRLIDKKEVSSSTSTQPYAARNSAPNVEAMMVKDLFRLGRVLRILGK